MRPLSTPLCSLGRFLGNSARILQREAASVFCGLGILAERVAPDASVGKAVVCKNHRVFSQLC